MIGLDSIWEKAGTLTRIKNLHLQIVVNAVIILFQIMQTILFFDLRILETETKGNSEYLVIALEKFYNGITIPKNSKEKYKPIKKLKPGSSFLLNPKLFFDDKSTDIVYKAQYIKLAGRRNYLFYKSYGIKYLDLSLYPDINLGLIKSNPLLTITDKQIKFKYEETYNGT